MFTMTLAKADVNFQGLTFNIMYYHTEELFEIICIACYMETYFTEYLTSDAIWS
jgi:hypothetical protein